MYSIKHLLFVYVQLNEQKDLFQIILNKCIV